MGSRQRGLCAQAMQRGGRWPSWPRSGQALCLRAPRSGASTLGRHESAMTGGAQPQSNLSPLDKPHACIMLCVRLRPPQFEGMPLLLA